MKDHIWIFPARVTRVVDGDTLDVYIDAGFHAYRVERLRLFGVNAPEVRGPEREQGLKATAFVVSWLEKNTQGEWPLLVRTYKTDVFGRYLAEVLLPSGESLNQCLFDYLTGGPYE